MDLARLQCLSSLKGNTTVADRREHQRTDTMLIYDVRSEGKGWSENYVNISVGGLKFKTDRRYSLGAHVNIDLSHHLCSSSSSLRTMGKVVRARETHGMYETAYEVAVE